MNSLSEQFYSKINPRVASVNKKAGEEVARLFQDEMESNTRQGKGFGSDPYDANYSQSHARARRRKGLQTSHVDLRMDRKRIEQTHSTSTKTGTKIEFAEGGNIFKYHHTGSATGGKTRSIWPKSPESIPEFIKLQAKALITGVLRGEK